MKQLLALPRVYEWFQQLVGATRSRARYINDFVKAQPGERILDIGCGPGDIIPFLPKDCPYVGVDLSQSYIDKAKATYGDRGTFLCCPVDAVNPAEIGGEFDLVLATGVIHHLNDDEARALFHLAAQKMKHTGRFCSLDGCYTQRQNPLARWMLRNDRGRFVREQAAYEKLAATTFQEIQSAICTDLYRIPFTHLIMTCVKPKTT